MLGKPATRFQPCLLRSYLLSIALKVDSITEWYRLLKITPLYAILSDFPPHDTPGVGTFYDFLTACGSLTETTTSISLSIKKLNRKKIKNGVIKLHATLTVLPKNSFPLCNASTFQTIIPFPLSSGYTKPSSLMHPSTGD